MIPDEMQRNLVPWSAKKKNSDEFHFGVYRPGIILELHEAETNFSSWSSGSKNLEL